MAAGKAQLVEFEQRQIRLFANRQLADVSTPQQARRTASGPAQHEFGGDFFGAVTQALEVQRLPRFEDHVRRVIGGRAIHAQPYRGPTGQQFQCRANARRQSHVGTGAMADTGFGGTQTSDFLRVEVNAMSQPGARAEPADAVQIIHGAQAKALQAERFFIEGFCQVGMQAYIQSLGQFSAVAHDLRGY